MIITDLTNVPEIEDITIRIDGDTLIDIYLMLDQERQPTTDLRQAAWMLGEDEDGDTIEIDLKQSTYTFVSWH